MLPRPPVRDSFLFFRPAQGRTLRALFSGAATSSRKLRLPAARHRRALQETCMRIIAGACRGRTLHTVTGPGYRPAMGRVRESLFSMLEARGVVWGAVRVLDVFAGSGSLGFEALSRGAVFADFVEKDHNAAECLRKNAANLGLADRCAIHEEDALRVTARRPAQPCQLICIDPPYGADLFKPTLKNIMRQGWLADDGFLVAEVEKGLPLRADAQYDLRLEAERLYGNTRILVWVKNV